ncbi:hypothetical protein S7711_08864, partial [Stachybotrys chartarum IBT 7711]
MSLRKAYVVSASQSLACLIGSTGNPRATIKS